MAVNKHFSRRVYAWWVSRRVPIDLTAGNEKGKDKGGGGERGSIKCLLGLCLVFRVVTWLARPRSIDGLIYRQPDRYIAPLEGEDYRTTQHGPFFYLTRKVLRSLSRPIQSVHISSGNFPSCEISHGYLYCHCKWIRVYVKYVKELEDLTKLQ